MEECKREKYEREQGNDYSQNVDKRSLLSSFVYVKEKKNVERRKKKSENE
jgi:hypothetical protein